METGIARFEEIVANPELIEQIEDVQYRDLVKRFIVLNDERLTLLEEICILQVRLEERYPDESFDLPKLASDFDSEY